MNATIQVLRNMSYVQYRLHDMLRSMQTQSTPFLRTSETVKIMLQLAQELEDLAAVIEK